VCGPMNIDSIGGCRYYVIFKDDCISYWIVKCINKKSNVLTSFQEMVNQVHRYIHYQIHILQSDYGGEYTRKFFQFFLKKELIRNEMMAPYTLEQNEKAK